MKTVGLSLSSLLGLLFIGLKLAEVIDWNWIWVLAPFWVGVAFLVVIVLGALLIALIVTIFGRR